MNPIRRLIARFKRAESLDEPDLVEKYLGMRGENGVLRKTIDDLRKQLDAARNRYPERIMAGRYSMENYSIPLRDWFDDIARCFAIYEHEVQSLRKVKDVLRARLPEDLQPYRDDELPALIHRLLTQAGYPDSVSAKDSPSAAHRNTGLTLVQPTDEERGEPCSSIGSIGSIGSIPDKSTTQAAQ